MARAGTIKFRVQRGPDGWEIARIKPRPKLPTDVMTGHEVGKRLCEAWGIDPNRTRRITIDLDTGEVATVTVEQFITRGQADDLAEVATTYGLHHAEPVRQLSPGFTIRDLR